MARFNEILAGHFNRGLFKLLAMKGEAPAPQISSEIYPIIQIPLGAEYRVLDSWERWATVFAVGAVAAQTSFAQLRNPKGSNVVGVVEKMTIFGQAAASVNVGKFTNVVSDFGTLLTPVPLDGRQSRLNASLIGSSGSQVAGIGANIFFAPGAVAVQDAIFQENQEIVLAPGDTLQAANSVVNQTLTVTLWWRERFLEDSERTV